MLGMQWGSGGEGGRGLPSLVSHPSKPHRYLATLTFVGNNEKVYMPPKKDIWQRYLRKFTKQGKLLESDLGLLEETQLHSEE